MFSFLMDMLYAKGVIKTNKWPKEGLTQLSLLITEVGQSFFPANFQRLDDAEPVITMSLLLPATQAKNLLRIQTKMISM